MTILSARSQRQLDSARLDVTKLANDTSFNMTMRWLARDAVAKGYRYQVAIMADYYAHEMAQRSTMEEMKDIWIERAGLYFNLAKEFQQRPGISTP